MNKQKSFADQVVKEARQRRHCAHGGKTARAKTGQRLNKLLNKENKK